MALDRTHASQVWHRTAQSFCVRSEANAWTGESLYCMLPKGHGFGHMFTETAESAYDIIDRRARET